MNKLENDNFILPDGRNTSDLKVVDLKKELNKLGLSKIGTKSELLSSLNKAMAEMSNNSNEISKVNPICASETNIQKKTSRRRITFGVDLDDYDGIIQDQSIDTLELATPIDHILNPQDDTVPDDQNQMNLSLEDNATNSAEEEDDEELQKDEADVVEEPQTDRDDSRSKSLEEEEQTEEGEQEEKEEESDESMQVDKGANIAVCDGNIMDEMGEDSASKRDMIAESETIRITIRTDVKEQSDKNEPEVTIVPITARLGKRKVSDNDNVIISPRKIIRRSSEDRDGDFVPRKITMKVDDDTSLRKIMKKSFDENAQENNARRIRRTSINDTKGMCHLFDEPMRVKSPTTPKYAISEVVRVDNLVRPFTMTQLQDLLSQKGKVHDLWLNRIKSCAYVKYGSESDANDSRDNLDGCKWPSINPKLLVADFVSKKEMEWMKENGDSGISPPTYLRQPEYSIPRMSLSRTAEKSQVIRSENEGNKRLLVNRKDTHEKVHIEVVNDRLREKEPHKIVRKEESEKDKEKERHEIVRKEEPEKEREKHRIVVNEECDEASKVKVKDAQKQKLKNEGWKEMNKEESRERLRDRQSNDARDDHQGKKKDRMKEPCYERNKEDMKEGQREVKRSHKNRSKEVPVKKMLEELFHKTVATPPIYWQPVDRETKSASGKMKASVMHLL